MAEGRRHKGGGRKRGNAVVANDYGSRRPLQRPLAHVPGGRGADKEGGANTTISLGGEGEWAQKWGCNDDYDEYGADKVASAVRTIRKSTIQQ